MVVSARLRLGGHGAVMAPSLRRRPALWRTLTALLLTASLLPAPTRSLAGPEAFPVPLPEGEGPDGTKYKTGYACEDSDLGIVCDQSAGEAVIQVIRANFGRFSIAICNPNGFTDWSVNCMAPKTTRILQNRCDGKASCSMPVNSRIFGDPCPNTQKYVEVHYACAPKNKATTKRPLPPWFIDAGARDLWNPDEKESNGIPPPSKTASAPTQSSTSVSSSTSLLTSLPSSSSSGSTSSSSSKTPIRLPKPRKPILVTQPTTPVRIPITTPTPKLDSTTRSAAEDASPTLTDSLSDVEVVVTDILHHPMSAVTEASDNGINSSRQEFCRPVTARNIHWNWTRRGEAAIVPCPHGATGLARWTCLPASAASPSSFFPSWSSSHPDLSDCKSNAMARIEARVREEDGADGGDAVGAEAAEDAADLAELTSCSASVRGAARRSRFRDLYGGDLEAAASVVRTLANRIQYLLQNRRDTFRDAESYIQSVFQNVLRSASHLVGGRCRQPAWADLRASGTDRQRAAKVASSLLLALEENAFLLAQVTDTDEYLEEATTEIAMAVSVVDTRAADFVDDGNNATVVFPQRQERRRQLGATVALSGADLAHNADHSGLSRAIFFSYRNLHKILGEGDFDMNSDDNDRGRSKFSLNSRVVSASLSKGRHVQLRRPARLALRHLRPLDANATVDVSCAFWDLEAGAWSDSGCRVDSVTSEETVCLCDHLTHFAVVVREDAGDLASSDDPEVTTSSDAASTTDLWTVKVACYVSALVLALVLSLLLYKYRSALGRLLGKLGCVGGTGSKKSSSDGPSAGGGGGNLHGGCPKSQSFFSGINLLTLGSGTQEQQQQYQQQQQQQSTRLGSKNGGGTIMQAAREEQARISQYYLTNPHLPQQQQVHLPSSSGLDGPTMATSVSTAATLKLPNGAHQIVYTQQIPHELYGSTMATASNASSSLTSSGRQNNPYSGAYDGLEATRILRDRVYEMSPQLAQLTSTLLRQKERKKSCSAGGHPATDPAGRRNFNRPPVATGTNDPTMLPESEVVFRAVSPHGHVYWEIDPRCRDAGFVAVASDEENAGGYGAVGMGQLHAPATATSSAASSSRQSSSRYSDNMPLIAAASGNTATSSSNDDDAASSPVAAGGNILVNPFADVQLAPSSYSSACASPTGAMAAGVSSPPTAAPRTSRFSSLRSGGSNSKQQQQQQLRSHQLASQIFANNSSSSSKSSSSSSTTSGGGGGSDSPAAVEEHVQKQVQIRDLKSIPGNVKSTDYILAKIQSHMSRGSPVDIVATTKTLNNSGSPRQRKV